MLRNYTKKKKIQRWFTVCVLVLMLAGTPKGTMQGQGTELWDSTQLHYPEFYRPHKGPAQKHHPQIKRNWTGLSHVVKAPLSLSFPLKKLKVDLTRYSKSLHPSWFLWIKNTGWLWRVVSVPCQRVRPRLNLWKKTELLSPARPGRQTWVDGTHEMEQRTPHCSEHSGSICFRNGSCCCAVVLVLTKPIHKLHFPEVSSATWPVPYYLLCDTLISNNRTMCFI